MRNIKSRHILLITCEYVPFPGGIATYAGGVAQTLRESGYHVTVAAPSYPDIPYENDRHEDNRRILGHHQIGVRGAVDMLRIIGRLPADSIILGADIRSVLFLYVSRIWHRRPYRSMIHGSEVAKFRKTSPLFALARRAYLSSEVVLYNSQATRDIFVNAFGSPVRDAVSYLGVEASWFEGVDGDFNNAELAAIPADKVVISTVGRIEPRKGHLETVRAVALAQDKIGPNKLVYAIAGRPEDERYTSQVVSEAKKLNVSIVMTGRISEPDLKRLYRRSALHVLYAQPFSGKVEGFGLVLLEAAAQGCPTAASRTGGIPEVLGNSGILLDPQDIPGLAEVIAESVDNPNGRERRGKDARIRAESFTWRACVQKTFPELELV
ncbi:UNVERIFIED_ORG: phosphatidylinositol alpha-1,6-mannosyltransferase [Rhizobium sophorae]|uniref:glycosyltransferase family 4 protein n=1 Tax=Rhizobium leguminosarum TaxID=384 RepID=UPI000DE3FA4A|nr:glycosyltransferase family 4 protein [Rhizobium leguminosarum]MBB4526525.1 phosphatidylinositol alpha-1,6-mannosyltransferase [Rhizobium leguminosarum]MDH6663650.1 phosphatidylinositol alpha-1,6-mannosyltransferase [Rhizobium sophorae]